MREPEGAAKLPANSVSPILSAVRLAAEKHARPDLVRRIDKLTTQFRGSTALVLIVGEFRQGKSTLANALVGASVVATDDLGSTAVATVISHGAEAEVVVTFAPTEFGGPAKSESVDHGTTRQILLDGEFDGHAVDLVEIMIPAPLLGAGVTLVDTPGIGGLDSPLGRQSTAMMGASAAVLFVSDCSQELTAAELARLGEAVKRCSRVVCVMPKKDFYPHWRSIVAENERRIRAAGLDVPVIPVATTLFRSAAPGPRDAGSDESGFVELLGNIVKPAVDKNKHRQQLIVLAEVRRLLHELQAPLVGECELLDDPARAQALVADARTARDRVDRLRSDSSRWSTVLNDGIADLGSNADHDLRHRSRQLLVEVERRIDDGDPADMVEQLPALVEQRLMQELTTSYAALQQGVSDLTLRVGAVLEADIPDELLPDMDLPDELVASPVFDDTIKARPGLGSTLFTGLRGSYGGIAMLGMLVGMAGPAIGAIVLGPASLVAGVIFGRKVVRDDRERQLAARRQQTKLVVRREIESVVFGVSKHTRDNIRETHRTVRDHMITWVERVRVTAAQALTSAEAAVQLDAKESKQRLSIVRSNLVELDAIIEVADRVTNDVVRSQP